MISLAGALVLVVALASVWAMVGVIWTVQLVHYPIFDAIDRGVDDDRWRQFGDRHRRSISWVVGPFMLAEGLTGLWMLVDPPGDISRLLPVVSVTLMAVAYGTTAFVSVPLHEQLATRYDDGAHRRLVTTNWIRTAAWSARGLVVGAIAVSAITR